MAQVYACDASSQARYQAVYQARLSGTFIQSDSAIAMHTLTCLHLMLDISNFSALQLRIRIFRISINIPCSIVRRKRALCRVYEVSQVTRLSFRFRCSCQYFAVKAVLAFCCEWVGQIRQKLAEAPSCPSESRL